MQLFNAVPESFFSVLNSKYKNIYGETISLIYKEFVLTKEIGIRRDNLLAKLYDLYISLNLSNKIVIDEEEVEIELKDFSSFILRKLKDTGWIIEEIDNNYQKRIVFTIHGFQFAQTIEAVKNKIDIEVTGYSTPIDYQSYIYTIYLMLKEYKELDGDMVIERIYKEMQELSKLLLSINSNIKSYLDKSLEYKDLEKLLELHFDKYMNEVIGKSYHQLKTSDNVAKYKGSIIDRIEELLNDENYLNDTCQKIMEKNEFFNKEIIYNSLRKKMIEVLDFFMEDMDNLIRTIDYKNAEYIKSTINRIKYISNKSQNVEGQITAILKHLTNSIQNSIYHENEKDTQLLSGIFSIYSVDYIDGKSFYTPHAKKAEFIPSKIVLTSDGTAEERMKELMERLAKRLNKSKAFEAGQEYLKDKEFILGSDIDIASEKDFLKFINMLIYSSASNIDYRIELLSEFIEKDDSRFKEFILRRK